MTTGARALTSSDRERPADAVVKAALDWIGTQPGKWFAWVHVYDPHEPYAPPGAFAGRFPSDPYLGEVSWTDSALGAALRSARASQSRPTLVVVTGRSRREPRRARRARAQPVRLRGDAARSADRLGGRAGPGRLEGEGTRRRHARPPRRSAAHDPRVRGRAGAARARRSVAARHDRGRARGRSAPRTSRR